VPVVERVTWTEDETEELGAAIGRTASDGGLVGLVGELGAGKTCFVRGLARGLGVDPERVQSPTFVIATEYPGGRLPLHHVDLYRLADPRTEDAWLRETLFGDGVTAVEWFDRFPDATDEVLVVTLENAGPERRDVRLEARGARHETWLARALEAAPPG
jgi:tRNA threonylcarbamoyladenosine biosynthesis protein TsaE